MDLIKVVKTLGEGIILVGPFQVKARTADNFKLTLLYNTFIIFFLPPKILNGSHVLHTCTSIFKNKKKYRVLFSRVLLQKLHQKHATNHSQF